MKISTLLILFGTVLTAAPITRVTLADAGHPVLSAGSEDAGPYDLKMGSRVFQAFCIDFADSSKLGSSWSAAVSNLSGALGETYHPEERSEYAAEAYLYSLIVKPRADRVDLQEAAWAITDSSYHAKAAAEKYVLLAEKNASTMDLSRFEIVSGASEHNGSRPQEFLTAAVPEPVWMHVLTGAIAVGLILLGRRRS